MKGMILKRRSLPRQTEDEFGKFYDKAKEAKIVWS